MGPRWADFEPNLGRLCGDFGPTLDQLWAGFGPSLKTLGVFWLTLGGLLFDFGSFLGPTLERLRIHSGMTFGKLWGDVWPTQDQPSHDLGIFE